MERYCTGDRDGKVQCAQARGLWVPGAAPCTAGLVLVRVWVKSECSVCPLTALPWSSPALTGEDGAAGSPQAFGVGEQSGGGRKKPLKRLGCCEVASSLSVSGWKSDRPSGQALGPAVNSPCSALTPVSWPCQGQAFGRGRGGGKDLLVDDVIQAPPVEVRNGPRLLEVETQYGEWGVRGRGRVTHQEGPKPEENRGYRDRGLREKDKWQIHRRWEGKIAFRDVETGKNAESRGGSWGS